MEQNYKLTFFTLKSYQYQNKSICSYLEDIAERIGISSVTIVEDSKGIGKNGNSYFSCYSKITEKQLEIIMTLNEDKYIELFNHLENEPLNFFYTETAIKNGSILIDIFILD